MSYVTIKIPKELAREIDKFIEESKNLGHISRGRISERRCEKATEPGER